MTTAPAHFYNRPIPNTLDWAGKFRLTLGIAVCFAIFWLISTGLGIPPVPDRGGSLLTQPQPSVAVGAVGLALIVCTLLGKFIVGDLFVGAGPQSEGGLIAALIGMVCLVIRVGPIRYAYFSMPEASGALLLAVELILIYIVVAFCWLLLQWAAPNPDPAAEVPPPDSVSDRVSAVAMHVLVMGGCMMFLAASDAAGQGLAAVAISAALASMAACLAFPVNSSVWFLIGPAIVGLIGFGSVYLNPSGLTIGYPDGALSALARATPLAYATAGPAGAIFGFWMALGWRHADAA